jgi:amino acid transporter
MNENKKAFGLWSAIFLGIGSMVGAGIFIVIGQAGTIAGNLVWLSFILGGIAALLSGYSLAKLAITYPSRGGIVEYLVQGYKPGVFSGSLSILFYFSQLITIAAVAKSFGTYANTFFNIENMTDIFAISIITIFVLINIIGASLVAKSENIIVFIKLSILIIFVIIALFNINPNLLMNSDIPHLDNILFAIGLTFFAYQGFSVITNTVEDMKDPETTILKAMIITILLVGMLYILTSIAVLGNLSLNEVIQSKDYALAKAAEPIFGDIGFKIIAITALLATASAINATLYATTEIGYTLAKQGNLPKVYEYKIHNSYEGLIISGILIIPMILFLNLSEITTIAALVVLIIQGLTHLSHLYNIKKTGANIYIILSAIIMIFTIIFLTIYHTIDSMPYIIYYLLGTFLLAIFIEILLRITTKRVIKTQITDNFTELKKVFK